MGQDDIDCRLLQSTRLLRGWKWMSLVSTARGEAIAILSQEAKFLVKLGPKCPQRAQQIGRLIVGYERMISALRT